MPLFYVSTGMLLKRMVMISSLSLLPKDERLTANYALMELWHFALSEINLDDHNFSTAKSRLTFSLPVAVINGSNIGICRGLHLL